MARKDIEIAANAAEIHATTLHIEKLKAQLAVLRRARFGRSSEKLDRDIEQLELLIGELEEETAEAEARSAAADPACSGPAQKGPATRERRQPVRKPLPPHLPRETVTHEPACACPGCGGTRFSRVGQDEREVLEYVPSSFKVIRHIRPKLSCRACETIVQEPMSALPIERGRPGPGLIAHVLVSKYCDHTPLHRQTLIYAREGVELDRSTLADWVGSAVFLLAPLAEAIGRHIRAGAALHADDTTVPVLAPGLGRTKTGRLWVLVRDERPWGSAVPPAAFYRYSADRKGIHAEALLGTCRGFLHADGYAGFDKLYRPIGPEGEAVPRARRSRGRGGPEGEAVPRARRSWSRLLAGAMCAASSSTCTTQPPRRSRSRPCSGSRRCSPSRPTSGGNRPTAAPPRANNWPGRCWTSCGHFSTPRSAGSAARARSPKRSVTRCRDGRRSAATPTTAGSTCPTTPPSAPSDLWCWAGKTICSPVPTPAGNGPPASTALSRPQR